MLHHVLIKDNGAASKIDDVLIEHGGKVEGTIAYNTASASASVPLGLLGFCF